MAVSLTPEEDRFVRDLLSWDRARRRGEWMMALAMLTLGGLIVVVFAILTLRDLNDRTALTLTVPGFLVGAALVVLYWQLERRIRERHRIASVIRKLKGEG
jgi:hypothetical protein